MGSSEPLFLLPVGLQKGRDVWARSPSFSFAHSSSPLSHGGSHALTTPSTGVSQGHIQFLFLSHPGKPNRMW